MALVRSGTGTWRGEFAVFAQSHRAAYHLRRKRAYECDDVVFLAFRPFYIKPQQRVYAALPAAECSVCYYSFYHEMLATQHSALHPPVCARCFARLRVCPFCRAFLDADRLEPVQRRLDRFLRTAQQRIRLAAAPFVLPQRLA